MAVKVLTPVKAKYSVEIKKFAFEAATAVADGFEFTMPDKDESVQIIVTNTDAAIAYDITLKVPTSGNYAAASADKVLELAAGEYAIIRVESAVWADNAGLVTLIPEDLAVKAVVLY